jgi:hypothetical protein
MKDIITVQDTIDAKVEYLNAIKYVFDVVESYRNDAQTLEDNYYEDAKNSETGEIDENSYCYSEHKLNKQRKIIWDDILDYLETKIK